MMKNSIAALVLLSALAASPARAQSVELRPVDRATVRIVSIRGADGVVLEGRMTRRARVLADFVTTHGSGLAIDGQLVVTAAHVLSGAEHWAVIPPGRTEAIPAYPRYIDPTHDVAFLEVASRLPHHIALGRDRRLSLSEQVSASGYPIDVRESTPAAVTGQLSRVGRDGRLHLAMTVNTGHSGGPVIDAEGRPIGIISARGRTDQGIEGLTIAVSLATILAAQREVPRERHRFTEAEREVAAALPFLLRLDFENVPPTDEVIQLVRSATARQLRDAEADAILAVTGWNTLLARLEHANPPPTLEGLRADVVALAFRALSQGPHLRRHFPVLRAIAAGRLEVPAAAR